MTATTARATRAVRTARVILAAVLGLALPGALALPAGAAPTGSSICVGVVVAYGQLDGNTSNDFCTTVPSSSSGVDVLVARAKELERPAPRVSGGLVCAIDGLPATGCGATDPHGGYDYWAYWHRARGATSWSYSTVGADSWFPPAGSEEGWSWVQGQSEAHAPQPPLVAPATVCPNTAPVRATPTPTPVRSTPAASVAPTAHSSTVPPTPHPGPVLTAPPVASTPPPTTSRPPASAPATPTGSGGPPAAGTPAPQHLVAAAAVTPRSSGSGIPIGIAVAAVAVAALGAGAWWRVRSR